MDERNWAGNFTYTAQTIMRPATVDEIAEAQDARSAGRAVRVLGSRHSFNAIADTDGALLDTSEITAVDVLDGENAVQVSGGIRYGELAPRSSARGWRWRTPPHCPTFSGRRCRGHRNTWLR